MNPTSSTELSALFKRGGSSFALGNGATLLLLAIVAIAARMVVFGNPVVGFDEQFYLLVGDRMLHGSLPYVDLFDRKPIGIFLIYAGARLLGGEGFVQYKLVAALFVIATAFVVFLAARRRTGWLGAALAAVLYILWLNFMEGEGGQTPVFYNLFMVVAGALMLGAVPARAGLIWRGAAAMLLVGIAIQVKYSAVFEGIFFGCAFLWLARRHAVSLAGIAGFAVLMVALALLPTGLAALYYWAIGHWQEFLFCNFVSVFGQGKGPFLKQIFGLANIIAVFLPLILVWLFGRRAAAAARAAQPIAIVEHRYLLGWIAAAIFGVLIYWRFNSPHYAMSVLVPACLLLAPALQARRRVAIGLAAIAFVAAQIVLTVNMGLKGANAEARALAALAMPKGRCIFVYNGYPALYMMTHSCLPSRWAFPGHVNAADENYPRALGADPLKIVGDILAARPDAIVDTYPVFQYGNPAAHDLVRREIRTHYELAGCVVTGKGRVRLVYRLKGDGGPRALDRCPADLMREF